MRLVALGGRPLNADESVHAAIAYGIAGGRGFRWNPEYHGPLGQHLTAASLLLFGASDWSARLPWALAGLLLLALALPLARRRGAGVGAAFLALVAVSPTYAVLCREIRGDTLGLVLLLAALLLALRATPARLFAATLAVCGALALKGTPLLSLALAAAAALAAAPRRAAASVRSLGGRHAAALALAAALGVAGGLLLVTGLLAHPEDWTAPARYAAYWWGRQAAPRYPGSVLYYPMQLAVYEPLICVVALAALLLPVGDGRRGPAVLHDRWRRFLGLWLLGVLGVHGWVQEKLPHIALYPLLPATLLAAEVLGRARRPPARLLAALALAVTACVQLRAVTQNGVVDLENLRHLEALTYRSLSPDLPALVSRLRAEAGARPLAADRFFRLLLAWPLRDRTLLPLEDAPAEATRIVLSRQGDLVSCTWRAPWDQADVHEILGFLLRREAFGEVDCQRGTILPAPP